MVFNITESDQRRTVELKDLPYEVQKVSNVPIPAHDGSLLYAHIWMPKVEEGVSIGTIIEYLPYRKNEFTAIRDSIRHPYYAGYGIASMRVDMRGSGDSDGVLEGEYLPQEQEDNLAVFDWIVKQPWSNGKIGQVGKSWGGFNGLQVAYHRHPALKSVITVCSTDDRYSDDVHYRGGCVLASDMLWWASTMFPYNARPQDPEVRPGWRKNWFERLNTAPNVIDWMSHQTRDGFWKHGSICEDYSKVDIPVLAIGGWRDGYTNAVFRLVDNLPNPESKGIIGPWVHEFPEVATPYPGLGYNQIVVMWFTKHLTDSPEIHSKALSALNVPLDFDLHTLGKINAYIQEPCSIRDSYKRRDGEWIKRSSVKPSSKKIYYFDVSSGRLRGEPTHSSRDFTGSQEHGLLRGTWCPFGQDGDFPADQKIEDAKCLTFDGIVKKETKLFGFPMAHIKMSVNTNLANLTVRLVDVDLTTNENSLISWGTANLSHLSGNHEFPKKLTPGEKYDFSIQLDAVGYVLAKGHILRLSLSPTDWPSVWPLPKTPVITIFSDSWIELPVLGDEEIIPRHLLPGPESLAPMAREILRDEDRERKVIYDYITGEWAIDDLSDEGERRIVENNMKLGSWNKNLWKITENDPLSAYNQCDWELTLGRNEWNVKLNTKSSMRADENSFFLYNKIWAYENNDLVFEKEWNTTIPRNFT